MSRTDDLKRQIAQIDELIQGGMLTGDAAKQARARLEEELLGAVLQSASPSPPTPTPAPAPEPSFSGERPSAKTWLGIAGFVVAVGVAGYAWLGNREGLAVAPGATAPAAAASGAAHAMGVTQIEGLIEKLAERLKNAPEDAEGWSMLGRSYSVLGRHAEAVPAYKRVIELRPTDGQAHADLADALASATGKSLDGEPEQLIAKALTLEPDNPKALSLSGTIAFNRGDAAGAARQWERALKNLEPGSDMARQMQGALDEARLRAGLPAQSPAAAVAATGQDAAAPASTQGAAPAAASGATVQGRVTLAASLAGKASPDDTVFVFARPVAGARAPLAILRKQVKDLPIEFTLDDSLAMSPSMRISTVTEVVVGARISKSGNAMPQPGDLQGLTPIVKVGAKGVAVEIAETIK